MNRDQMVELWERQTAYEFELKDADLAVSTMVDDAIVMHLPIMSGGVRKENLRALLRGRFHPWHSSRHQQRADCPGRSVTAASSTSALFGSSMTETRRSCCRDWRRPAKLCKYQRSSS